MTFDAIPSGSEIFIDANTLIYHFTNHPKFGAACTRLLQRVENHDVRGYTSAHGLADVGHRLMTIEAMHRLGWPTTRLAARLKQHHKEIPTLMLYQQALVKIGQMSMQVLPVTEAAVLAAAAQSHQFELLTGDAIIVAVMQAHAITNLASGDADFDRVGTITRYAPV